MPYSNRLHRDSFKMWWPASLWLLCLVCFSQSDSQCHSMCRCLENHADCSSRSFKFIPNDLPSWVNSLDMGNNSLQGNWSYILSQYQYLSDLKLDGNSISNILAVGRLNNLKVLSMSHNKINKIPINFWENLPNLTHLDLSYNEISFIVASMFPPSNLTHLNLNGNHILKIEKNLEGLRSLMELKISRNHLSHIHKESFRNLSNLRVLELNGNSLTEIEGLTFQGLSNLEVLKLRHNSILYLRDGAFYGLHKLKVLRMDRNSITSVSKQWTYGLRELKELYLSSNKIMTIDENAWESCTMLVILDLSDNKILELGSQSFQHLKILVHLNLNNNLITSISEGTFSSAPFIRTLDLEKNGISWAIEDPSRNGIFHGLHQIKKLSLAFNQITSISPKAFAGLESLVHFNLIGNDIKAIHEEAFSNMTSLRVLSMNSSSLVCDCGLLWFQEWLEKINQQYRMNISRLLCEYPESLKGQSLWNVSAFDLKCLEHDSPKPVITQSPSSVVTVLDSKINLKCTAWSSSNSTLIFKWRKNNSKLLDSLITVTNNTSCLGFPSVTSEDAGKYQCIVTNNYGTVYSEEVNITVLALPSMVKKPGNITVRAGHTARLECAAVGEPSPQVRWQKDGGTEFPAAQERRLHVMPTDDVFFIINAKPADSGLYSCIARNTAGTVVANATLTVLEAPSFTRKMHDLELLAESSTVLECMTSGSPKPKIRWWKDGMPILPSRRHYFTADNQLLVIIEVQNSDAGSYQCEISNSLGVDKSTANLVIVTGYGSRSEDIMGVIIITVVCCAVGTSTVWVIIIYQTKNRSKGVEDANKTSTKQIHADTKSEHSASSKDSGTGDSTKRSHEDLSLESSQRRHQGNHIEDAKGGVVALLLEPVDTQKDDCSPEKDFGLHLDHPSFFSRSNHERLFQRPFSTFMSKSTPSLASKSSKSYSCLYSPPPPTDV